jgi:hypothetical protein
MTRATQYEIMQVLEDVRRLSPHDLRFGQLLANLGLLVADRTDRSLWDVEDEALLKVVEEHRADLLRRHGGEGMERSEFLARLQAATDAALAHAAPLVTNVLPAEARYLTARRPGEALDAEELTNQLLVHGAVPAWIDIGLQYVDDRFSYLYVGYSSRRTREEGRLRYKDQGLPPFQIGGPYVPLPWIEEWFQKRGMIAPSLRNPGKPDGAPPASGREV